MLLEPASLWYRFKDIRKYLFLVVLVLCIWWPCYWINAWNNVWLYWWINWFSSFFNPKHPTDLSSFYTFLIASAVTIVVSFIVTWVWGYNDKVWFKAPRLQRKREPGSSKYLFKLNEQ